ncbi:hypothetical protein Tco_1214544 [Tanacetum coccineum]
MESEFVALSDACKEAKWLINLIIEISLWSKLIALISIRCDSDATLTKAYSQMYNGKSRHLGVKHILIRELIMNGVVSIEFVRSQQNLADHLTKELTRDLVLKKIGVSVPALHKEKKRTRRRTKSYLTYPGEFIRREQVGLAGDLGSTNNVLIPLLGKMDNPDLTMEEYIELEAKKARRHGRTFNWETATYDSEKDIDKVNLPRSDVIIKQLGDDIDANVDTESHEFNEDFETNHDIYQESFNME